MKVREIIEILKDLDQEMEGTYYSTEYDMYFTINNIQTQICTQEEEGFFCLWDEIDHRKTKLELCKVVVLSYMELP